MRCPDCNKFVPYDTDNEAEIEDSSVEYNKEMNQFEVTATVKRVLPCAECSTELKETTFDLEGSYDAPENFSDDSDLELDLEVSNTERYEGKGRGTKTFYGVEVTGTITANGETLEGIDIDLSDDCQASYFEELT